MFSAERSSDDVVKMPFVFLINKKDFHGYRYSPVENRNTRSIYLQILTIMSLHDILHLVVI